MRISLGHTHLLHEKQISVQYNIPQKPEKYINLNKLIQAIDSDPDLSNLPEVNKGSIYQSIFIASGCDYVSFFSGYGKVTFVNTFCQHASFINGTDMEGSLCDTHGSSVTVGFLAFIRLIGTLYFKKYLSAFVTEFDCETPQHLFLTCDAMGSTRKFPREDTKSCWRKSHR